MHLALLALLSIQDPTPPVEAPKEVWTQARLEAVAAEIQTQIEEVRGQKFTKPVDVKLTDEKGLIEYAAKRERETSSTGRRARDETIAKLLGLIPPEMDLEAMEMKLLQGQVAGFYDPKAKCFYLMDKFAQGAARFIMSHELTHALDDQLYDLDALIANTHEESDAELAVRCVAEGSGTNAMYQWYGKHTSDVSMADLMAAQDQGSDAMAEVPACVWKPLIASYFRGEGFLVRSGGLNVARKPAKADDIVRAFRAPPRSTEQILHPDKYWNEAKRDDPLAVHLATDKLPEGWTVLGADTLGEMNLAILTSPPKTRGGLDLSNPLAALGIAYTNKGAEGWGGDRIVVLARGDERFLQLATAWDTEKDAEEFAAAVAVEAFAGPRDAEHGFRAGMTPTWSDVKRAGPKLVVVRVGSTSSTANDAALASVSLAVTVNESGAAEPR